MSQQLPAVVLHSALAPSAEIGLVPALIADAGEQAGWRYVEFFTVNIRNPNTRRAYARACARFFAWCDDRGLTLTTIRPFDVAAWVEGLQEQHSAPGVKQQLAAVRMLFDWLITGQIVPANPSSAVRGPKHVVKIGKTPVLDGKEWRKLIDTIPTETVRDLRDRALIATLTYSFARIGAALKMKVDGADRACNNIGVFGQNEGAGDWTGFGSSRRESSSSEVPLLQLRLRMAMPALALARTILTSSACRT